VRLSTATAAITSRERLQEPNGSTKNITMSRVRGGLATIMAKGGKLMVFLSGEKSPLFLRAFTLIV
jgi:hypothetical protein